MTLTFFLSKTVVLEEVDVPWLVEACEVVEVDLRTAPKDELD